MPEVISRSFIHTDLLEGQVIKERIEKSSKNIFTFFLIVTILVLAFLFFVWSRLQVVDLGYQISKTSQVQRELIRVNKELKLELDTLKSPSNLEKFAKDRLKLVPPQWGQVIIIR